ncbi:MAG TPA: sialidase family protein [Candidatus Limnocylindrales bacterium]|nr:sialidase family protein [Candidatus Limnocylindrales bacterium]
MPIAGLVLATQPATTPLTANAGSLKQLTTLQQRILSGFASQELSQPSPRVQAPAQRGTYFPTSDDGCPTNLGSNIKVNQNCLNLTDPSLAGRGQAQNETAIAQDPSHPDHVVATFNDYRRGDGNCYGAFSRDGGRTWTDTTIPMGFTNGSAFGGVARQYWQAGGDTSVAWDTKGNAYVDCQVFMRGPGVTNNPDFSSAMYLFRSTHNGGASWNFPGRPVVEQSSTTFLPLLDKPYMTVDNHAGSPFQDRVYVTWTLFLNDGTANIYEANSSDYGESFSAPVLVSTSSTLCPNAVTGGNHCDANQDSDPFTGPDGALYVAFNNFNNALNSANDNRNQILLAKSTDGGATFSAPIKVADWYDLPDCPTYQGGQDPGRACVPEQGSNMRSVFRATNYPSGGVKPGRSGQIVVTFGSFINRYSNESTGCVPAGFAADFNNAYTGVKTPACNNKILLSVSNDGGATFTGTTTDPRNLPTVNTSGQAGSDQWWQWAAFSRDGQLAVSYYDRRYGNDETTGFSDISLSGSGDLTHFGVERVTSSSMPVPTQFPDAQGNSLFFGDYAGLSAATDALPLWMDTRSPDLFVCPGTAAPGVPPQVCTGQSANGTTANDQDIFVARVSIPSQGEGDNGGSGGNGH